MKHNKLVSMAIGMAVIFSCKNDPKVITATTEDSASQTFESGIFTEEDNVSIATNQSSGGFTEGLHSVVAKDVLPTSKYVYVNVAENGQTYWIAVPKMEVTAGNTYFYRNGLLKTNFESKEYKRVFDTIYLVSNLVPKDHSEHSGGLKADYDTDNYYETPSVQKEDIPTHTDKVVQHKGSITIAELVANPSNYQDKTVQLTGKVVKINPNIMNRNWIHLQDGSKDDYDLVITSDTFVAEGKTITIRAKVTLDKDFGAGYRYDIILEEGVIIE